MHIHMQADTTYVEYMPLALYYDVNYNLSQLNLLVTFCVCVNVAWDLCIDSSITISLIWHKVNLL